MSPLSFSFANWTLNRPDFPLWPQCKRRCDSAWRPPLTNPAAWLKYLGHDWDTMEMSETPWRRYGDDWDTHGNIFFPPWSPEFNAVCTGCRMCQRILNKRQQGLGSNVNTMCWRGECVHIKLSWFISVCFIYKETGLPYEDPLDAPLTQGGGFIPENEWVAAWLLLRCLGSLELSGVPNPFLFKTPEDTFGVSPRIQTYKKNFMK